MKKMYYYRKTDVAGIVGYLIGCLVILAFLIICGIGYIFNIVKLAEAPDLKAPEVVRVCGIFIPPAGVIMGYMEFGTKE